MSSVLTMNPRTLSRSTSIAEATTAFHTPLGWIAIRFEGEVIAALKFGFASKQSALAALPQDEQPRNMQMSVEQLAIQQRLIEFASGQVIELTNIEVACQWQTPFAQRVVAACRGIPYGETLSYGEVAAIAGSPGAARAVGNVMASNCVPLVVPCHRVIGSHGALGGYSARGGVAVKQQLLDLEAAGLLKRRSYRSRARHI